jgi:hypothetical protein
MPECGAEKDVSRKNGLLPALRMNRVVRRPSTWVW